jgi:hypothetical protein
MSGSNGSRASRLQEENYREFTPPLPTTVAKFSCGPGNPVCFDSDSGMRFPSEYPHSVLEPLGRTIPSPSARNATAKRGSERPLPIACYLPPGACTLTHAFANSPIRTQRTSMKHGCWIVAQRRVSCRWSTPQRKAERLPAARILEMTAYWCVIAHWALSGHSSAGTSWAAIGRVSPDIAAQANVSVQDACLKWFQIWNRIESAPLSTLGVPSKLLRRRPQPHFFI